ncbi:MAG: Rieske 2Fe-2S domain-containing protein [Elusimicrobia bacterium]|nr:Rieske 2Fe-2S domain-containing protein [Elusimicrobiota bacterium]
MAEFRKAARAAEIPIGAGKTVEMEGKRIALFNMEGKFYAVDDACLHKGGPLGEGSLEGSVVTCPWHGWQYDVKTGVNTRNSKIQVKAYAVKLDGEDLLIQV